MSPPAEPRAPILLFVAAMAIFSGMDAVVKHLVAHHPVLVVTFWRYVVAAGFVAIFWARVGRPGIAPGGWPVHFVRVVAIAVAATAFFFSLTRLTLAEATAIGFVSPLLVPPLAAVLLGEPVNRRLALAGLGGFAGVVLAARPATLVELDPARLEGLAAVLVAAMAYALSVVLLRARARADGAEAVSLVGAVGPALLLAPLLPLSGAQLWPSGDFVWFLAAGALGAAALQLLARAYARAEAQQLAPFEYTALLWAALWGWLAFGEGVALETWAGAALIAGACLFAARAQTAKKPSPSIR